MKDKRFMTDEERAEIGRDHRLREPRNRAGSEPAADAFAEEDHLTPLTDVVHRIEEREGRQLTESELAIARNVHQLAADRHMRVRQRRITPDTSTLLQRIDEVDDKHTRLDVDLRGDGNREHGRIAQLERFHSRIVKWALGSLIAIAGAAISFGIWMGSVRTDIDNLKQRSLQQRWRDFPMERTHAP